MATSKSQQPSENVLDYRALPLGPGLNTIRLLRLLPPSVDPYGADLVECELRVEQLNDDTNYTALSYVWGGEKSLFKDVQVNGVICKEKENLESALRHLRASSPGINLWTDALCINQKDSEEKAVQVDRMHAIYANAKQTIVWLGPAAMGSAMAFRALRDTGREAKQLGIMDLNAKQMSHESGDEEETGTAEEKTQALGVMAACISWNYPFKAVRRLSERDYWNRLWILQEFALSKRIVMQCGLDTMSGEEFMAGTLFLPLLQNHLIQNHTDEDLRHPMDPTADYEQQKDEQGLVMPRIWHLLKNGPIAGPSSVIGIRRDYAKMSLGDQKSRPVASLLDFLERIAVLRDPNDELRGCHDGRDRIYGMLGMLGDIESLGLKSNYKISAEELYCNVARLLMKGGCMRTLCYAGLHHGGTMPTWAPDWRERLSDPCMEKGFFCPAANLPVTLPTFSGGDIMSLSCVVVDTVTFTGIAWEPETHDSKFKWKTALALCEEIRTLISDTDSASLPSMTAERWQEGIWRIPIADQYTNTIGLRIRAPASAALGYDLVSEGEGILRTEPAGGVTDLNLYQIAMSRLHGRRVVKTEKGFIGLAPRESRRGDLIVIVPGVDSPLLVGECRKTGKLYHQLVGEAYLYGIMDGEFVVGDTKLTTLEFR